MGTNYYLEGPGQVPCCKCGRPFEKVRQHIGKSSAGWVFTLHVYPEKGINDLPDWWEFWNKDDVTIKNEYGDTLTSAQMLTHILARFGERSHKQDAQWYRLNQAEEGPYGLARAKIDGHRVIGHGLGTYSMHTGPEESW